MQEGEPRVRFPVRCPVCRQEITAEYRTADLLGALINGRPIRLYASCHDASWTPSYVEVQQIRAHFSATRLEPSQRQALRGSTGSTDD
jgi:hypothetical protein